MKKYLRLIYFFIVAVFLTNSFTCTPDPVVQISLDKTDLQLEIGKSERLVASFEPAGTENTAHTWRSTDPEIASVDETGLVTGLSFGECEIIATALTGGSTAVCEVRVIEQVIDVENIVLNKTELAMAVGEKQTLVAKVIPQNATNSKVRWATDNEKIATVEDGEVTAVSVGIAEISAVSYDGKKYATCVVEVQENGVTFSDLKISEITNTSVHVEGDVYPIGLEVDEMGVCWSTSSSPTIDDSKKVSYGENISLNINNLEQYTEYYARMYAIAGNQIYYGGIESFMTTAPLATKFEVVKVRIDSRVINSVQNHKRDVWVKSSYQGYSSINVCYGFNPNPKITDYTATANITDDGKLTALLTFEYDESRIVYLRSYSIEGKNVIYNDDEVSLIINEVSFTYEPIIEGKGKLKMSYETLCNAVYKVLPVWGDVSKTDVGGFSKLIYIEGTHGVFYYDAWYTNFMSIITYDIDIKFINMETDVEYFFDNHYSYNSEGDPIEDMDGNIIDDRYK